MTRKIRWGILSTANIGTAKVIPAMQKGQRCTIDAIASRDLDKARQVAARLGIPRAYGTYEELLRDPEIDAIYNPLPNHLHVPWSVRAVEAGKHVLCEKPLAMSVEEAGQLIAAARAHPGTTVMEAFMYRFHPQWKKVHELLRDGALGEVRSIHSVFFYYNVNPADIRNQDGIGGGGLLDIGCYCISLSRFVLGREPERVMGVQDFDPKMKVDRLTTGMLDYAGGVTATFACSTQLTPFQHARISGTKGILSMDIPFTPAADKPARMALLRGDTSEEILSGPVDQYTLQGDAFAEAALARSEAPTPLEDAVGNMRVIDAVVRSSKSGQWVALGSRHS